MTTQRPGIGICKGQSSSEQQKEGLRSHITWNSQAWKLIKHKEHTEKA